jgi:hypothetical protein
MPEGPVYYVVQRDGGRVHKEPLGRDRRHASQAFSKVAVAAADGDYRPQPTFGFSEWADRWLASLKRKASRVDSYRSTVSYAKEAFGGMRVRLLGPEDILRLRTSCASTTSCEIKAVPRPRARSTCAC